MRSYEAARTLFSFLAFCAWSVVVIGVLVALIGASGGSRYGGASAGLLAMAPGLGIGIAGLLLLAFVQMGRAGVDTAEYTQQMLKIARDQLEVSRQGLNQGQQSPKGFADIASNSGPKPHSSQFKQQGGGQSFADKNAIETAKPETESPIKKLNEFGFTILNEEGTLLEYRGREIEFTGNRYVLEGQNWPSGSLLKRHLNQLKIRKE